MSDLAKFIEAEKAHTAVLSAGYGKDATPESRAAREAAQTARGQELGFSMQKAGIKLISPNGELQMSVSKVEVSDARNILAGEPITWKQDATREGATHKAGDAREPSITAKFLAENAGALSNNKTNATGLDAITFKPNGNYAVAYMKPDAIVSSVDTVKAVTAHTRGTTILIEKNRREQAVKSKGAGAGIEA